MRASEPDCAHYLKKGWCAFGATCKFNHPELNTTLLGPRVPVANPNIISPMAAVGNFAVPSAAAYPAAASVPTMLYVHSNQIMQGPAGAAPMGYPAAMQPNAAFMRAFDGLGTAPARI